MTFNEEQNISCPKFGGSRFAPACCTQDRYRSCRKNCASLGKHLKQFPDLPAQAKRFYQSRLKTTESGDLFVHLPMEAAGRGLPDLDLQCPLCGFRAKTPRGRKMHGRRTHGRKLP